MWRTHESYLIYIYILVVLMFFSQTVPYHSPKHQYDQESTKPVRETRNTPTGTVEFHRVTVRNAIPSGSTKALISEEAMFPELCCLLWIDATWRVLAKKKRNSDTEGKGPLPKIQR